jgi:hypothetical protein
MPFIVVVVSICPALGYGDAEEPDIEHMDDHDNLGRSIKVYVHGGYENTWG